MSKAAAADDLASALRAYRLGAGINQHDIAQILGVSQSQISRWESGRDRPGPANHRVIQTLIANEAERQRRALIRQVKRTRAHAMILDSRFEVISVSPPLVEQNGLFARFGWLFVAAANPAFDAMAARYRKVISAQGDRLIGIDAVIPFSHGGADWLCTMSIAMHRAGWEVLGLAEIAFEPDPRAEVDAMVFTPVSLLAGPG